MHIGKPAHRHQIFVRVHTLGRSSPYFVLIRGKLLTPYGCSPDRGAALGGRWVAAQFAGAIVLKVTKTFASSYTPEAETRAKAEWSATNSNRLTEILTP